MRTALATALERRLLLLAVLVAYGTRVHEPAGRPWAGRRGAVAG